MENHPAAVPYGNIQSNLQSLDGPTSMTFKETSKSSLSITQPQLDTIFKEISSRLDRLDSRLLHVESKNVSERAASSLKKANGGV